MKSLGSCHLKEFISIKASEKLVLALDSIAVYELQNVRHFTMQRINWNSLFLFAFWATNYCPLKMCKKILFWNCWGIACALIYCCKELIQWLSMRIKYSGHIEVLVVFFLKFYVQKSCFSLKILLISTQKSESKYILGIELKIECYLGMEWESSKLN